MHEPADREQGSEPAILSTKANVEVPADAATRLDVNSEEPQEFPPKRGRLADPATNIATGQCVLVATLAFAASAHQVDQHGFGAVNDATAERLRRLQLNADETRLPTE